MDTLPFTTAKETGKRYNTTSVMSQRNMSVSTAHTRSSHDQVSGDWANPKDPQNFIDAHLDFLKLHSVLYQATNPRAEQAKDMAAIFVPAIAGVVGAVPGKGRVVGWEDIKETAAQAMRKASNNGMTALPPSWEGVVEMIICAQAGAFLGSWGSTFSAYIHRLRGYMPHIQDKRILYHNKGHNPGIEPAGGGVGGHPSWAANSPNDISWAREYPDGFQL
eukprot:SAG31_NODE_785_length_12089_cov_4.342936_12_plen_219_part_00